MRTPVVASRRGFLVGLGVLALGRLIPPAWYLDAIGPRRQDRIVLRSDVLVEGPKWLCVPGEVSWQRLDGFGPVWSTDEGATFSVARYGDWLQTLRIERTNALA